MEEQINQLIVVILFGKVEYLICYMNDKDLNYDSELLYDQLSL